MDYAGVAALLIDLDRLGGFSVRWAEPCARPCRLGKQLTEACSRFGLIYKNMAVALWGCPAARGAIVNRACSYIENNNLIFDRYNRMPWMFSCICIIE